MAEPSSRSIGVLTHDRFRGARAPPLRRMKRSPNGHPYVVENGSEDETASMVRRLFSCAGLVEAGRNLGAGGRTLGVAGAARRARWTESAAWWVGALAGVRLMPRACRVVPEEVEEIYEALDAVQQSSGGRRYVS